MFPLLREWDVDANGALKITMWVFAEVDQKSLFFDTEGTCD
jgi:hypothetical protein